MGRLCVWNNRHDGYWDDLKYSTEAFRGDKLESIANRYGKSEAVSPPDFTVSRSWYDRLCGLRSESGQTDTDTDTTKESYPFQEMVPLSKLPHMNRGRETGRSHSCPYAEKGYEGCREATKKG